MTWYFDATGTTMDVYDHTGTLVAEGREFSGSWPDAPDEVLAVMQEEATAAAATGDLPYALRTVATAAFEDVEEGTP